MLARRRFLALLGLSPLSASASTGQEARYVCFQRGRKSPLDSFTCWYGLDVGVKPPQWVEVELRDDGLPAPNLYVPRGGGAVDDYLSDYPFPSELATDDASIRIVSAKVRLQPGGLPESPAIQ